jgi:hypothetical protein
MAGHAYPGRLNDLLHIVYCGAGERLQARACATILRPDLVKENVDGEAIEWAVSRLRQRDESRKCLIVISDGAPVADATLLANGAEYLNHHLRGGVRMAEQAGDIQIAAVGIGRPVEQYVSQSVTIDGPEQLEGAVVRLIEQLLCNRPERRRRPKQSGPDYGRAAPMNSADARPPSDSDRPRAVNRPKCIADPTCRASLRAHTAERAVANCASAMASPPASQDGAWPASICPMRSMPAGPLPMFASGQTVLAWMSPKDRRCPESIVASDLAVSRKCFSDEIRVIFDRFAMFAGLPRFVRKTLLP